MKYRITIESEKHDDDGRITWKDVYQQVIEDLCVNRLVADLNSVPQLLHPIDKADQRLADRVL